MAVLDIRTFPDPMLTQQCSEVQEVDDELRELAADMADTMYEAPGIGLAAPQVGRPIRMIVFDCEEDEARGNHQVLLNPRVVDQDGEQVFNEGCLSVPDYTCDVKRAERVTVTGTDLEGQPVEIEADGLLAVCLQHEIDHLSGTLFIDRISQLKRSLYRKRRMKQIRREAS